MTPYKILVIKNRLKVNIDDDLQKAQNFFASRLPFPIEITVIETDILGLKHSMFKKGTDGREWYGTEGLKDLLRNMGIIELDKYHAVEFYYDRDETIAFREGKVITSWTFFSQILPDVEYSEIITNEYDNRIEWIYKSIIHERMHQFCNRLTRQKLPVTDYMDSMPVNGVMVNYHKNDEPEAKDGNFAATFAQILPYYEKILTFPQKELFEKMLIALKASPKTVSATSSYKYFSQKEVDAFKLEPEVWERLDSARGFAGVPFNITSGKRTVEQNKRAGGVSNSSHLKGLAVDLKCLSSDTDRVVKIVYGLGRAGFHFVEVARKHIHADMDINIHASKAYYEPNDD